MCVKINIDIFILTVAFFLIVTTSNLSSQEISLSKETINLKAYPVEFNSEMGISTRRLGEGQLKQMDTTLIEIPPGGQVAAHQHLAEEMIYIVSGDGYTLMWNQSGEKKIRYDWAEGDMLSPTLNAWHQHYNNSSDTPARYLSVSSSPLTNNLFNEPAFLSSSDFVFEDCWQQSISQQPEYEPLDVEGPTVVRMRVGHHISDLSNREMRQRRKDVLGITVLPEGDMAGNQIMEWEVREYQTQSASSPGHRHPWETIYYILDGTGYAILQRVGEPERRVNWQKGDFIIVEGDEYHGHYPLDNTSPRLWQMKASGYFHNIGNFGIQP